MEWFNNFLTNFLGGADKVAYIIFLYAFIIAIGALLGKIKVAGVSLGVTFVLFVGIIMGHFNFQVAPSILHFIQEFGLIIFVFCIGLQVGPSFFDTFKKGGFNLNALAIGIIALNVLVALSIFFILGGKSGPIELPMLVGVMYGAVTNTPGLGAAQEVLTQQSYNGLDIALGYACAYPLGVLGIIGSIIAIKHIYKIDLKKEETKLLKDKEESIDKPIKMVIRIDNPLCDNLSISELRKKTNFPFVCSHKKRGDEIKHPNGKSKFKIGDEVYATCSTQNRDQLINIMGSLVEDQHKAIMLFNECTDNQLTLREIIVTKHNINGRSIKGLHIREEYSVSITKVKRAGTELLPSPNLELYVGDKLSVVGTEINILKAESLLGNSLKSLHHPNLVTIFIGIAIGILFGSLSVKVGGMPGALKLGLAGGPLVIAILIGRFGHKLKLVSYTTNSANLMLREIGLALFLASVGLKAGQDFVSTVIEGDGLLYVGIGVLITVIPLIIIGIIGRSLLKINYFTLIGLIAGSTTDPPALGYSTQISNTDTPAVAYSTVYPLSMFLRIMTGQIILLLMTSYY